MRRSARFAVALGLILIGSGIAAYPFVSNYLYEHGQKEVILEYDKQVENAGEELLKKEKERAEDYNASLREADVIMTDPFDPEALSKRNPEDYESLLNIGNDGVMGYLEIPALELNLNVYHGTGTRVLERGVGHLEMTSLPVGGESTHAVLSAHAGLPGKKLFTDLEMLEKGDMFFLRVLNETLAYQVDQIRVVKPEDTKELRIQSGKDYVTLVTCTPYGVNSHRLLVRGTRVPYEPEAAAAVAKKQGSTWMRQYFYGVLTGFLILFLILIFYLILRRRRKKNES